MTVTYSVEEVINNYPKLVDELTYICYKYNRDRSPNLTPDQWRVIFGNTDTMEQRYQEEIKGKGV